MRQIPHVLISRFGAAAAAVLLVTLACSVDLGLKSEPDETEIAKQVEGTLAAERAVRSIQDTQTALARPTDTPAPTFTSTILPSETPVPTDTLTPTPEGVNISAIQFAIKVDENGQLVNPGTQFKKGSTKLYGGFTYSGIPQGAEVVFRWDNNGKEFSTIKRDWNYAESGDFWVNVYWVEGGGLPQGNWKLSIYIDGKLVQSGTCVIYQ